MALNRYAAIWDPTNPFYTHGISAEVEALLDYLMSAKEAGLDVVATSTTDHPRLSKSGNVSRHRQAGTNGEGLAIDCRMRQRGLNIHRAVFDIFVPVEKQLHELIYAGAPFNIRAGKRVPPYSRTDHRGHVHASVSRGTLLRWPGQRPTPPVPWKWSDYMPAPLDRTSAAACPTGGYWEQSAEGGIYAEGGAPHLGAYNANPQLHNVPRLFSALVATPEGGYVQIATTGEAYTWKPK